MNKPHPTQTGLTRRTALAGVLALASSAAPALAASATPDDAELLRVVQAGLEAYAAFEQLCREWCNSVIIPEHVIQREIDLMEVVCEAHVKAGSLIASTQAGLQAKARLAVVRMTLNAHGEALPDSQDYLVWSLCRDLLGAAA